MSRSTGSPIARSHALRLVRTLPGLVLLLVFCLFAWPQATPQAVDIRVNLSHSEGTLPRVWNYFGYDEPNYSYAPNGQKLLAELADLSPVPVYVRVHNLLTTGDGSAALKWGSTNVYTEDGAGNPVFSWPTLDRIFDAFHDNGIRPLVEVGFMPQALSVHPDPYRHHFPQGTIYTGWAYPPKDYRKWAEVVFQFARHLRQRYGDAEVKTWLWEVWNEPDIGYWQGTPEEFFKLYDFAVDAILRAYPEATVGGPDTTGPADPKAAEFLRLFLEHCARGQNYVSGKTGSPLHFVSFHAKGSPQWRDDHVRMGIARQLASIQRGFQIVKSFPQWSRTPIILGESDPEGCAACSARSNPQNAYRNGSLYASYTTEVLHNILALVKREHVNFQGAVTWAFEFEDQPYFEGFRDLATNGVDKPVLNAFRMFGMLGSERLEVTSSGALPTEQIVEGGVRAQPDINAMAARKNSEIEILVWHYHDDDLPGAEAPVDLTIHNFPENVERALLEHFRVDTHHSNAFTQWQEMGSPQSPTAREVEQLRRAGQLQLLTSPSWVSIAQGTLRLHFSIPRQGLSLVRIAW